MESKKKRRRRRSREMYSERRRDNHVLILSFEPDKVGKLYVTNM